MDETTRRAQAQFEQKIDDLKKKGLFPAGRRGTAKGKRYLIISYGGTGSKVLFEIKKKLEQELSESDYEDSVRLLAIDTDRTTQRCTVTNIDQITGTETQIEVDHLNNSQFCELICAAARQKVEKNKELGTMSSWLSPNMPDMVHADPKMLVDGASACRQAGRAAVAVNAQKLYTDVFNIVNSPFCSGVGTELEVIIVTGISGGTGSGIVIDATYIIRKAVEAVKGVGEVPIYGFVVLPRVGSGETVDANQIRNGNKNGYAALKEIDRFMTLRDRHEVYHEKFFGTDTADVRSESNLFDNCFLVDNHAGGVHVTEPLDYAKNVIAQVVLDLIAVSTVVANAADPAGQEKSFGSTVTDGTMHMQSMLSGKTYLDAPRDANYIYHAIGNAEVCVPMPQLRGYIAYEAFAKTKADFAACGEPTVENADKLVADVAITSSLLRGVYEYSELVKSIKEELKTLTLEKGPYYVNNLLVLAVAPEEGQSSIAMYKTKLRALRPKQMPDAMLDDIESILSDYQKKTYVVLTTLLDVIGESLQNDYDAEVNVKKTRHDYSIEIANFGNSEGAVELIGGLFSQYVNEAKNRTMVKDMLEELYGDLEKLDALVDPNTANQVSDIVRVIRDMWAEKINAIVDKSVEDFILAYFTYKPGAATPKTYDKTKPAASDALCDEAVAEIMSRMFSDAVGNHALALPLFELTSNAGMGASDFKPQYKVYIPANAVHLEAAFKRYAVTHGNLRVLTTGAQNKLSCQSTYQFLPAFRNKWVISAEQEYDNRVGSMKGLHMSETAGGRQWANFPSLIPVSAWSQLGEAYTHSQREKGLADKAGALFEAAKQSAIAKEEVPNPAAPEENYYVISVLPQEFTIDDLSYDELDRAEAKADQNDYKLMLADIEKKTQELAEELLKRIAGDLAAYARIPNGVALEAAVMNALVASGVQLKEYELKSVLGVQDSGVNGGVDGWTDKVSAQFLRKSPEAMYALRGTMKVIDKLMALARDKVEEEQLFSVFELYLATGHIACNEDDWTIGGEDLTTLSRRVEQAAPYYFVFRAFKGLEAEQRDKQKVAYVKRLIDALRAEIEAKYKRDTADNPDAKKVKLDPDDFASIDAAIGKTKLFGKGAYVDKAGFVLGEVKRALKPGHDDEDIIGLTSDKFEKLCKPDRRQQYDREAIEAVYRRLTEDLAPDNLDALRETSDEIVNAVKG